MRYLFIIVSALVFLVAAQLPHDAAAGSAALEKVIEGEKKEGLLKLLWTEGHFGGDLDLRAMLDAMNKRYGTNRKLQFTQGGAFPRTSGGSSRSTGPSSLRALIFSWSGAVGFRERRIQLQPSPC